MLLEVRTTAVYLLELGYPQSRKLAMPMAKKGNFQAEYEHNSWCRIAPRGRIIISYIIEYSVSFANDPVNINRSLSDLSLCKRSRS